MKVLHSWLKEYCGEAIPNVQTVDDLLTFHAFEIDGIETVGDETVIDVKILPDRASDALSHRGIAHEISALTSKSLAHDPLKCTPVLSPVSDKLKVTIENPENCRRFSVALMTGVKVGGSPEWLATRLKALGQRSINNVVDATNYVMLSLGQPLHAYDAKRFVSENGVWHFNVRMAREGEEVVTLTGETKTLSPLVQVIANMNGDVPVGIAGIKGGKSAEVDATTVDILLESANFNPQVTRKASQALKLQTDASKRFENNLSPELASYALVEVVELIKKIAGGTCEGFVDVYPTPMHNTPVLVTHDRINALLGITLTKEIVEDIFARLSFSYTQDGEVWTVTAPFERTDIVIAEDVIAEVGRVHGYKHIASVVPESVPLSEINARQYYSEVIRELLIEEGFSEVITSSFRKKDEIALLNALASDKGCLRSSLEKNIIETLDKNIGNADLLGLPYIQVFEIGTVFERTADGKDVTEHVSLALGVRMKSNGYTPKDDARLAEMVSKLETALNTNLEGKVTKGVYECNFTEVIAKLPIPTSYVPFTSVPDNTFVPYSLYPYITRDIALWVGEGITAESILTLIKEEGGSLLTHVRLFDEFQKDGRTSYAFRLIFQSFEKTLTDEEIQPIMSRIETSLKAQGHEIR